MLPSSRLFRSRWKALIWAGGMIWFAVDVATSAPRDAPVSGQNAAALVSTSQDATGEDATAADLAVLANAAGS